ncbi:uncharacterized protein LOC141542518 [Sminthopsis crassicaudata]|uniref:uncharacterized protein LOC141542518 n=1 Tax=Sminthopsis crassicaudata TaxID=9301 RepID=UPI003D69715A
MREVRRGWPGSGAGGGCYGYLGLCFLLLGRGGADLCLGPACEGGGTDPEPPQPKAPCLQPGSARCPGRAGRPSRSFLHSASAGRSQAQVKQPVQPAPALGLSSVSSSQPRVAAADPKPQPPLERVAARSALELPSPCAPGADCAGAAVGAPNATAPGFRDCKGLECRLPPLRLARQKHRAGSRSPSFQQQGEGCAGAKPGPGPGLGEPSLVRVTERAAQFIGEVTPELAHAAPDLGGAGLGVQLTCDIRPGENEVPSEDALILQLQLAKGQEKFVEMLKSQQKVIADLQHKLTEQQNMLISQQTEILEQQKKMYEQMNLIKVQYSMLFDTVKQMSFQNLQGDIQHYFQTHLQGLQNQVRNHLQKSYSVHKVEVDAKMIDVGETSLDCGLCESDEFCNFQKTPSRCEKCTLCPAGFFQMSECSANTDRICQDRDECIESPNICGERIKCLNTPGGFRCLGIAEKDAALGLCGDGYFFNREIQECQACWECEDGMVAVPCSAVTDTVCSAASETQLTKSWAADLQLPLAKPASVQVYPGLNLKLKGKMQFDIAFIEDSKLVFRQHGLLWVDLNFAVKHNCRNFLQLSIKSNSSEEGSELSGVRIEQPEGKYFQSASLSSAAEVEPSQTLAVFLRSPNQFCNQSKDLNAYDLIRPFSLFWLSHDTGAVAMSAQMSTAMHYQTNYRPTFKINSVSDPYMISLSHDGRGIRFTEAGVIKFVFHQALYSMGHTCVREGFSLISYIGRNGTNVELMNTFKSGVNYRDTSLSASGATRVQAGDQINFEIFSPAQCSVRYFGDNLGVSTFSLIWIPSAVSTALSATVSSTGLPTGAVRNKFLDFRLVTSNEKQIQLVSSGQFAQRYFIFTEKGVASVAFNLKLIHSCNVIKVTLNQLIQDQTQPAAIAQQIGGQMPEGSIWTSVSLCSSFEVHNGTMISISLDCVRGRINQIAHERGTGISILWISS